MNICTVIDYHNITIENMDSLNHMAGRKTGGCASCHCRTKKYAAWGKVFMFTCCNECFATIKREAKLIAERKQSQILADRLKGRTAPPCTITNSPRTR